MTPTSEFSVIIVTGLSGSGKSTGIKVFEDLGFFCVDGMPASMVPKLVELFRGKDTKHRGLVLGMDFRQQDLSVKWSETLQGLRDLGASVEILFLDTRNDVLIKRYATTRRLHPLESSDLGLDKALEKERKLLEPIRNEATLVLDTSGYSIHDLRRAIQDKWSADEEPGGGMRIHILSFGFKYGAPIDADLVFDMRFLPNPYFDPELRPLSGKDKPISDFVLGQDPGNTFKKKMTDFLEYLLPLYAEEGRYRITLGFGCTGGRHRSVAMAEAIYASLTLGGYNVTLEHRHLELG